MPSRTEKTITHKIGKRLRIARMELGLSQKHLGRLIGVTHQQIQKYESGRSRISVCQFYKLIQILKKPSPWFFEGLEQSSDDIEESNYSRFVYHLACNYLSKVHDQGEQRLITRVLRAIILEK